MIEPYESHQPQIHETAWIHPSAVVIGQVSVGANCSIWPNVTIRADEGRIVIGEGSNIQDGTTIHMTGGLSETFVGARVTVGHNCLLHGCIIEDDILVGMGAIVMDNVVIGQGSFVGAATLITPNKVVPPKSFVMGNPMKIVRECGDREAEWIEYAWRHYVENSRKYKAAQSRTSVI